LCVCEQPCVMSRRPSVITNRADGGTCRKTLNSSPVRSWKSMSAAAAGSSGRRTITNDASLARAVEV
jgi:hypothetical protein